MTETRKQQRAALAQFFQGITARLEGAKGLPALPSPEYKAGFDVGQALVQDFLNDETMGLQVSDFVEVALNELNLNELRR